MQVLILTVLVITVTCSGLNCALFFLFVSLFLNIIQHSVDRLSFTHRKAKLVIIITEYFGHTTDWNFRHHLGRGSFL